MPSIVGRMPKWRDVRKAPDRAPLLEARERVGLNLLLIIDHVVWPAPPRTANPVRQRPVFE